VSDNALGAAIRLSQQPRLHVNGRPAAGLAWVITDGLFFHNGGTGGFSASMAIDQATGQGAAALVNTHGSSVPVLDAAVLAAATGTLDGQ
jgi:hypothetical protein